jgi:hypothetical protein
VFYLAGKGNHLESCMIPKNSVAALDLLTNVDYRAKANVSSENKFLFPSTKPGKSQHSYKIMISNVCLQ